MQNQQQAEASSSLTGLKPFHVATFAVILASGLAFLAALLYFTADMQFQRAFIKVVKRLLKTVALRQVLGILAAMTFVRFGLEPLVKVLRRIFSAQGSWEKSSEYYILREVRACVPSLAFSLRPACCLLGALPQFHCPAGLPAAGIPVLCGSLHHPGRKLPAAAHILAQGEQALEGNALLAALYATLSLQRHSKEVADKPTWMLLQAMVQNLVRSTLSLTFVIAAARVVFNVKARMTREATWQLELKGDLTKQRRVEAVDKLLSVLTLLVASVFGLQAIGLDGDASNPSPVPRVAVCYTSLLPGKSISLQLHFSHRQLMYVACGTQ